MLMTDDKNSVKGDEEIRGRRIRIEQQRKVKVRLVSNVETINELIEFDERNNILYGDE